MKRRSVDAPMNGKLSRMEPQGNRLVRGLQCLLSGLYLAVSALFGIFLYYSKKSIRGYFKYQVIRYDRIPPQSPLTAQRLCALQFIRSHCCSVTVRKKILVLDLDETLIHSHHDGVIRPMVKPGTPPDFTIKVYGANVADRLDRGRGLLNRRYFRQHCTMDYGGYTKDLSAIHSDLSSIFILDNSPGAYRKFPQNAIPIRSWFSDPSDTCLLSLLPFLDALRFASDVRSILSRNQHLQQQVW